MIDIETRIRTDADAWRDRSRDRQPDLDALLPPAQHRSGTSRPRMLAVAAVVIAVAATAAAIAVSRADDEAKPTTSGQSHSSVSLDPVYVGHFVFQPRRTRPPGALSASAAWSAERQPGRVRYQELPPETVVMFGTLTRPGRFKDRPVWAYGWSDGCMIGGPSAPSPWAQCHSWAFLDAFSGKLVVSLVNQ